MLVLHPGAFRLLLALMVVASHISRLEIGRLGVVLFFVLSGYWISDLWDRQRTAPPLPLFYLNRLLRIWPLYMIAVLIASFLSGRPIPLVSYGLFGVASMSPPWPLGVEWSLDIEAQFYLVLPFIAMLRPAWWWAIPATLLGWIIHAQLQINSVLVYLPAFAAGIWLYNGRKAPLAFGPGLAALALAAFVAACLAIPALRVQLDSTMPNNIEQDAFAMIWAASFLPYIALSLRKPSSKLDRHLGNLSYPLYLIHVPILLAIGINSFGDKLTGVVAGLLASITLYVVADMPIERLRYRVLGSSRVTNSFARIFSPNLARKEL